MLNMHEAGCHNHNYKSVNTYMHTHSQLVVRSNNYNNMSNDCWIHLRCSKAHNLVTEGCKKTQSIVDNAFCTQT